ncbi:MAG: 50S ribosomal protein L7/L12 [Erysipelotrichaceae bacterium]|jgi:large subunit ribosomal protein L7/L12|nr:50S ribosomal protein L7/L12 [Erysipelotrichaceae bacterium]
MAKLAHEDILAYLEEASILELNDLVKAIEEKFGVTAAAPVAAAAAPAEAAAPEGPTSVNVVLSAVGDSKVGVIKVVKEITGLSLVEAKGLVDKVPSVIKENLSVEEADKIKKQLMDAGASVEYK